MTMKKMELAWKEYFRDPLLYHNAESTVRLPRSMHRIVNDPSSISASWNLSWVHQELRRRAMPNGARTREIGTDELSEERKFLSLLKVCAKKKDADEGARLHRDILRRGLLEKSPHLGSCLISIYAKWGMLARAEQVLESTHLRNVVSWNSLITGYTHQGRAHEALDCFARMQGTGLSPNSVTFICVLKACGKLGFMEQGKQIHEEVVSLGLLENDIVLGTAVVDMYAKCSELERAQRTFEELPVRNAVTWSALIAGYVRRGHGHRAVAMFDQMQIEGLSSDPIVLGSVLKACGNAGLIEKGKRVHEEIVELKLLETEIVLATGVIDMYVKCGDLASARKVLEQLPDRNTVSWSVLIAGYVEEGQCHEALACFERMWREGVFPDKVTFISILKACGCTGAIAKGKLVHQEIMKRGLLLAKNMELGTALIDMYAKCGELEMAREILEALPTRDAVSWCALIAGYVELGRAHEASNCFEQMQNEGLSPDTVTFVCVLKAYGSIRDVEGGTTIHRELVKRNLLEKDVVLGNALADMYVKCGGLLTQAHEVLEGILARNVVSWSTLIAGYADEERFDHALNCYQQMQIEGIAPNEVAFVCALSACGKLGSADRGREIHDEIVGRGLLGKNVVLGNALIDMYARCGSLAKAHQVLEELPERDTVSWNTLIAAYARRGRGCEALHCFEQMQSEGFAPNEITFTCIFLACSSAPGAVEMGKQIHVEASSHGFLQKDAVLGAALVDMYARCGMLETAREALEEASDRCNASWSALIGGYVDHDRCQNALDCVDQMRNEGFSPDSVVFVYLLRTCGIAGASEQGKRIHEEIVALGLLEHDAIVLGTAVVDMYARCGVLESAEEVLFELPRRNVVSWCALIAGYARQGRVRRALECFRRMQIDGGLPDSAMLSCLLNACARSGLLDEAQMLFADMKGIYRLTPDFSHYAWMVSSLGCAGHFDRAMSMIRVMPPLPSSSSADSAFHASFGVWLALLDACKKCANVELGKLAFDRASQLCVPCAAPYVLMSSIYSTAGMQAEVEEVEAFEI